MNKTVDAIKLWLSPILIGIVGWFIQRDLTELRTDVKTLVNQSAADHQAIQNLQADVNLLKQKVFMETKSVHFDKIYGKEENLEIKPQPDKA